MQQKKRRGSGFDRRSRARTTRVPLASSARRSASSTRSSKQYQDVDLGNKADLTNQFLLLGFGSSGKDLSAAYTIQSEGEETVGGKTTTKLQLIPKDAKVKEKLSKVESGFQGMQRTRCNSNSGKRQRKLA